MHRSDGRPTEPPSPWRHSPGPASSGARSRQWRPPVQCADARSTPSVRLCNGLGPASPSKARRNIHHVARTPNVRTSELLIALCRAATARRGPNSGFIPQEPAQADALTRQIRHDRSSEDMPSSSMGQWANDEVGADPADCTDATRSRRARRRIGGEHDAPSTWRRALPAPGRIEIRGFGSFSLRFRRARVGRNPRTGTPVSLPARYAPYFKPGKHLRQRLNRAHDS